MIEHKCPHCGHLLRIKSKYAGQKGGCKHCGKTFVVPGVKIPTGPIEAAVPPVVTAPSIENMDDLPALDTAFAQQMSDQPVEPVVPSTSLDDLVGEPIGTVASPGPPRAVPVQRTEAMGCVFWGAVFLVPPAGLVWSFVVPTGHPDRVKGIVVSSLFSVLAVLCVLVSAWLGATFQAAVDAVEESAEVTPVEQEPAPFVVAQPPPTSTPTPAPTLTPMPAQPAESVDAPARTREAPAEPVAALQDLRNLAMPSYPGLYLSFPERLTPALLGRSLSSYGKYDVRYISVLEGTGPGSLDEVSKEFIRQLTEQGFETNTSFGFSSSLGEYRTVRCVGADDAWFFAKFSLAGDSDVYAFVALYAGDSGLGFALPQYESAIDDPVPFMSGVVFAPPESVTNDLLDDIDEPLSAMDLRNLVIREAYVDANFGTVAETYRDQFREQGWEAGMAYGLSSIEYRLVTAQRDQWAVSMKIEDLGDGQSRIVVVSPLQ